MIQPPRCWQWAIAGLLLFLLTALPAYSEPSPPNRNLSYLPYYFGLAQSPRQAQCSRTVRPR